MQLWSVYSVDWQSMCSKTQSPDDLSSKFVDFALEFGFAQHVTEPTRGTNVLDILLANDPCAVVDCNVLDPIGNSDHNAVHFNVLLPTSNSDKAKPFRDCDYVYDFENTDFVQFRSFLSSVCWSDVIASNNGISDCWDNFVSVINYGISMFTPLKKVSFSRCRKKYPPYIRQLLRKKSAAWRRYKSFNSDVLKSKYYAIKLKCSAAIGDYIRNKEDCIINSDNLGLFYRYVNKKLVSKTGIGVLEDNSGSYVYRDEVKAELLNDYFTSVFSLDNNNIPNIDPRCTTKICDIVFTPYAVERKLKIKSSAGPDGLQALLLKNLAHELAQPLCALFATSLDLSSLPDIWRVALVSPVFKNGLSSDICNYRPISLTCITCKIMESIIRDQLMSYLLRNKLISKQQHGFISRHSACSQLIECVDDWSLSINIRHNVDVIYIDFSKAFDCVVHSKLLAKLASYGISGNLLLWIQSFLSGRSQAVKVGKHMSSFSDVLSGVPQGSVLGPLLFLLFINDITDIFGKNLTVKLYADDVKIYSVVDHPGNAAKLQQGLEDLSDWCSKWQMKINVKKCSVLSVGRTCSNRLYSIDKVTLPCVNSVHDLGVHVDSNLRFSSHYDDIVTKAHRRAALILRCFECRDPLLLFRAFTVYVRPILEYCSPVWSPVYIGDIKRIEAVQRRFTKRLSGYSKLSYATRLRLLGAEALELRRLKLDLIMMYKVLHGLVEVDTLFNLRVDDRTRGDFKIFKSHCNVNSRAHSFACRRLNCWNSLPNDVRNASSVFVFKSLLSKCDFTSYLVCSTA